MTGLTITAPSGLHAFCASLEKLSATLAAELAPIKRAAIPLDRAAAFIVAEYERSPLAKKRAAKLRLTAAITSALAAARKTLREIAGENSEERTPRKMLVVISPPGIAQHFAANAPNREAMHRNTCGSTRPRRIVR